MKRLPQGKSNFSDLVLGEFHYVDKTPFIRSLEDFGNSNVLFLRPRRFGKSLFVSMLMHYYGEQHRDAFGSLFGQFEIGQYPTPLANTYLTLFFEFSGIETENPARLREAFLANIHRGIRHFFNTYRQYFDVEKDIEKIETASSPADAMKLFFGIVYAQVSDKKIYLFIDEYDHFANELLAFNTPYFQEIVSGNGFVRKFAQKRCQQIRKHCATGQNTTRPLPH